MKVKEITLNEVANNPYDYELDQDGAQFIDKDGNSYSIKFIRIESGVFAVAFSSGIFVDQKTNRHDSFRIFATVIDVIKSYATKNQVAMIVFSANKSEPNRVNLYKRLALAFTHNSNYKLIDHSKEITDNTLKDRIQYLFWYLKTKDFTPFMLVNRKFTSENISEKQNQKYNDLDEGWKDQLFGLGLAGAVAAGSTGVMTAKQALTSPNQTKPAAAVAQNIQPAKPQLKPAQPTAPAKVVEPTVNYITNTPLEKYLMTYAANAGLRGYELAQFMAQCAHETQDFSRLTERGGLKYFRKYDPKYAPQKAKILGNTKVGDGARFKGRGFIQLTGRYNYGIAGKAIGQDLIKNPQLAEDPNTAAQIALWYWQNRVKPSVDDYKNTTDVTRKINPGLKGLEDRHENFIEYIAGDETDNKNVNEQGVAKYFYRSSDDERGLLNAEPAHKTLTKISGGQEIDENLIRINSPQQAKDWIEKVYAKYPQTWQNNHVMPLGGTGDDQQFALFKLSPNPAIKNAVEIDWFQAYPLRQGAGTQAMKILQDLAAEDSIILTLFPWDRGRISQTKLIKFYQQQGFRPAQKGSKNLVWEPSKGVAEGLSSMFSKVMGHETSTDAAKQIQQQGFKKSRTGIFFNIGDQNYSGGGYGGTVIMAKVSGPADGILDLADDDNLPDDLDEFADGEEVADYARSKGYWAWTDGMQFAVLDPSHIQVVQKGVAEGEGFDQEAGIGIDGKSFKFKIRDLVAFAEKYPVTKIDPNQFAEQIADREEDSTQSMTRIKKADLQYPIIVVKRKNGQLWIADGTHRAHKAILNKLPKINARIIPVDDMTPFVVKQNESKDNESKITVKPSPGKGNGLFATKLIKAGEVITSSKFELISDEDWQLIKNTTPVKLYGFKLGNKHALQPGPFKFKFTDKEEKALWDKTKFKDLSLSGFMFINGADSPDEVNSKEKFSDNTAKMIATKDIQPGEEIIKQYNVPNKGVTEDHKQKITWVKPNFDREYDEVEFQLELGKDRIPQDVLEYYTKYFSTKEDWLKGVQNGRPVVIPPDLDIDIRNNTNNKREWLNALSPQSHDPEGPEKKARVQKLFSQGGNVEMPIVLNTGSGLWLIGGKTRLGQARFVENIPAKVWMIMPRKQGIKEDKEEISGDLSSIVQSFVNSSIGQKYQKHDCKTVTRAFVQWAEQNKIPTQVISFAPPSAEFIKQNPKFGGKSGQGDGHIAPIVKNNVIDFTIRQFGINRSFDNPLITPVNNLKSIYGKFGYFTDKPQWFLGGKSYWIGSLSSIPSEIFNQNFGDELLEGDLYSVAEAKYSGNIGIMELIKFFQTHPELKSEYNEIKREKGAIEAMKFALDAINAELEGEPYSVAEDQTEDENITVQNNVETSFRGGYGGTLIAKTPDRQVGYLNYSIYNDKPQIGMIFVAQDYRRRGVAMKMLKALQELSPNEEIDWGITTDAGSNLRKSINYRKVPNPEIIKKKAKLAGVRSKLARLNYRLEQLKNTDVELARKFINTVGDRWNQLNDLEYRLENELYLNKGEYSKLISENK